MPGGKRFDYIQPAAEIFNYSRKCGKISNFNWRISRGKRIGFDDQQQQKVSFISPIRDSFQFCRSFIFEQRSKFYSSIDTLHHNEASLKRHIPLQFQKLPHQLQLGFRLVHTLGDPNYVSISFFNFFHSLITGLPLIEFHRYQHSHARQWHKEIFVNVSHLMRHERDFKATFANDEHSTLSSISLHASIPAQ